MHGGLSYIALTELIDLCEFGMDSQVNNFQPFANVVNLLKPVEHEDSDIGAFDSVDKEVQQHVVIHNVLLSLKRVNKIIADIKQGVESVLGHVDISVLGEVNEIRKDHSQQCLVGRLTSQDVHQLNS